METSWGTAENKSWPSIIHPARVGGAKKTFISDDLTPHFRRIFLQLRHAIVLIFIKIKVFNPRHKGTYVTLI